MYGGEGNGLEQLQRVGTGRINDEIVEMEKRIGVFIICCDDSSTAAVRGDGGKQPAKGGRDCRFCKTS